MPRIGLETNFFDSELLILVDYNYRRGARPIVSGPSDNCDPGYPAEVEINGAWFINPKPIHEDDGLSPVPDFVLGILNRDDAVYDALCASHEAGDHLDPDALNDARREDEVFVR